MKLNEIKGERSLDVLADIMEPIDEIMRDKAVRKAMGESKIKGVALAIKTHKEAIVKIMATLDGENPETYEYDFLTLPHKVLELLTDEAVQSLF